ncbi:MAG: response regulator [Halothece sp. Uz-M2-17]|nr:response regulator [Halothece sp. Uz-M2-17]
MTTVLIVEDGQADQKLMVSLLEQSGYDVIAKNSVEEAESWLLQEKHHPDLIVLDIVMPGSSGLDLCREIRGNDTLNEIPIVFCSSKNKEFDQFWAMRQGGNAYLTKPFLPKEFLNTVAQQLAS